MALAIPLCVLFVGVIAVSVLLLKRQLVRAEQKKLQLTAKITGVVECEVCPAVTWLLFNRFFMAALWNRAGHYIFMLWFLSSVYLLLFFLAYSNRSEIGCLAYFDTWCGPSANLECRPETCCAHLAENTGRKKSPSRLNYYASAYNKGDDCRITT